MIVIKNNTTRDAEKLNLNVSKGCTLSCLCCGHSEILLKQVSGLVSCPKCQSGNIAITGYVS